MALITHWPIGQRILGVDPGLQTTGYAVLEVGASGPVVREAGVIRTATGRETTDMAQRLAILYKGMVEVVDEQKPQHLAIEQLFAHYEHPRTAILMAHARGAILLVAGQKGVPVHSYASSQVKKTITGSGRASKEQMQQTMQQELRLAQLPEPHDVADALAIALCHYYAPPELTGTTVEIERDALTSGRAGE